MPSEDAEDRAYCLAYLDDQARDIAALVATARENPDDRAVLVSIRDEILMMREILDELGVPFSQVADDDPGLLAYYERVAAESVAERADEKYGQLVEVLAPDQQLGVFDGIPVTLVSVELRTRAVLVHLRGVENERTKELDAAYEAAFAEWTPLVGAAKKAGEPSPDSPPQPGGMLNHLPLRLLDDVGTDFRARTRAGGGSQTPWGGWWHFEPAVPTTAATLTVAVDDPEGRTQLHELPLRGER